MKGILALGMLAVCVAGARADILYTTGTFDPENAFASDSVAGQFNNQRLAEAFVISSNSNLTSVQWWGRSEGSFFPDLTNMSTFTVSVYQDAGAVPGTEVFTSTTAVNSVSPTVVGVDSNGRNLYSFNFAFASQLNLQQGTYWLSVGTENIDPEGDGFYWMASQDTISGSFAAQNPVGDPYRSSGFADLALQINGAPVPEPMTVIGLAVGAAGLLRRRRKA